MTREALKEILAKHLRWLRGEPSGTRANLTRANLTGADLTRADLTRADLTRANLTGADLTRANLARADLARANLTGANLARAYLAGANLTGADLTRANLTGAFGASAPVIQNIDAAILKAIADCGGELNMADWHMCETTHCRAGWAIHLAGLPGKILEERVGPSAAGALIYAASRPGVPVPTFFASTDEAIADLVACAAQRTA